MTDHTPETPDDDIYEDSPYIKEMQYINYPPTPQEMVYFVPMTGKRLHTIAFLLDNFCVAPEKITPSERQGIEELVVFVQAMSKAHSDYYNAIFAPQPDPEVPHG